MLLFWENSVFAAICKGKKGSFVTDLLFQPFYCIYGLKCKLKDTTFEATINACKKVLSNIFSI